MFFRNTACFTLPEIHALNVESLESVRVRVP